MWSDLLFSRAQTLSDSLALSDNSVVNVHPRKSSVRSYSDVPELLQARLRLRRSFSANALLQWPCPQHYPESCALETRQERIQWAVQWLVYSTKRAIITLWVIQQLKFDPCTLHMQVALSRDQRTLGLDIPLSNSFFIADFPFIINCG